MPTNKRQHAQSRFLLILIRLTQTSLAPRSENCLQATSCTQPQTNGTNTNIVKQACRYISLKTASGSESFPVPTCSLPAKSFWNMSFPVMRLRRNAKRENNRNSQYLCKQTTCMFQTTELASVQVWPGEKTCRITVQKRGGNGDVRHNPHRPCPIPRGWEACKCLP